MLLDKLKHNPITVWHWLCVMMSTQCVSYHIVCLCPLRLFHLQSHVDLQTKSSSFPHHRPTKIVFRIKMKDMTLISFPRSTHSLLLDPTHWYQDRAWRGLEDVDGDKWLLKCSVCFNGKKLAVKKKISNSFIFTMQKIHILCCSHKWKLQRLIILASFLAWGGGGGAIVELFVYKEIQ